LHEQNGLLGFDFPSTRLQGGWVHYNLADSVVADLEKVTHVSCYPNVWYEYALFVNSGAQLRKDLKPFSSLQQLSLVTTGSDESDNSAWFQYNNIDTPGHLVFKDRIFSVEDRPRSRTVFRVGKAFLESELTEEEKQGQIPDVRVITIERVTNIPGDDWKRDLGEPFVRIHSMLVRCLINYYFSTSLIQHQSHSSNHVDHLGSVRSITTKIPHPDFESRIRPHSYTRSLWPWFSLSCWLRLFI
jgi:hypothetical protein